VIAIKVTTGDPKRSYIVHFTPGSCTVVDVLDCRTIFDRTIDNRMTARTSEIVAAARTGIGKTFETSTKEKTSEDHV
jgi:hypothetical protein